MRQRDNMASMNSIPEKHNTLPTTFKGFFARVYDIVEQIPYGKVVSYGQIAWRLGAPRAARQVGWAMRHCPDELPWQRVVKADGSIAGGMYSELRRALIEAEGVAFLPDGRVDMEACRWEIIAGAVEERHGQ